MSNSLWGYLHDLYDDRGLLALLGVGAKNVYYVDAVNGSDNNDGKDKSTAKATLLAAYNLCTAGQNDTVVVLSNGAYSGTIRLGSAFTWAKDATHLIGVCSPVLFSPRARFEPTAAIAAFTPFFTISASGCIFQNLLWFHGFDTGGVNQINMIVTGSRNYFRNCHIAGMGDAASAASAGSRSLKLGGSGAGENFFEDCVIGIDTIDRSAANASIEFIGGAVRNVFRNCIFPFRTTAGTPLAIIGALASCMDRFQIFDRCIFTNHNTTVTALATLPASAGGFLLFKDCSLSKITGFGSDATSRAQIYIEGGTPAAATTGLSVNPTA